MMRFDRSGEPIFGSQDPEDEEQPQAPTPGKAPKKGGKAPIPGRTGGQATGYVPFGEVGPEEAAEAFHGKRDEPKPKTALPVNVLPPAPQEALPASPTFAQCDEAIRQCENARRQGYVVEGRALRAVRDLKLYRQAGYSNFDECCQAHWGFTRQRAFQIINSSEVASEMSNNLTLSEDGAPSMTDSLKEIHARELGKIPVAKRADVLVLATKIAGGAPTAAEIRDAWHREQMAGADFGDAPDEDPAIEASFRQTAAVFPPAEETWPDGGHLPVEERREEFPGVLSDHVPSPNKPAAEEVWPDGGHLPVEATPEDWPLHGGPIVPEETALEASGLLSTRPVVMLMSVPSANAHVCPACGGKGHITDSRNRYLEALLRDPTLPTPEERAVLEAANA